MGTRSYTFFVSTNKNNRNLEPVVCRQFDGYPRIHGFDIYTFLKEKPGECFCNSFFKWLSARDIRCSERTYNLTERQEWTYIIYYTELSTHHAFHFSKIEIYNYSNLVKVCKNIEEYYAWLEEVCGNALKSKKPAVNENFMKLNWESPDGNICESVSLTQRNRWATELLSDLSKDPTVRYIGSGDRMVIASVDSIDGDTAAINIEDCIVTRRTFTRITLDKNRSDNYLVKNEIKDRLDVIIGLLDKCTGESLLRLTDYLSAAKSEAVRLQGILDSKEVKE